jgi:hypothetical protein
VTDALPEEPPGDPRDALIAAQAERIEALEALVAEFSSRSRHVPVTATNQPLLFRCVAVGPAGTTQDARFPFVAGAGKIRPLPRRTQG